MRHLVIPDTQQKPGGATQHLRWAGQYAAEKKPDVIVHLGDHWDMPSLSMYDKGKKSFEGRRYRDDIDAGNHGMNQFMQAIVREQKRQRDNKKAVWTPRLVFLEGNHEYRMQRAIENDAVLEDMMGLDHTNLEYYGWEVYPFLEVVVIDGVAYSHYFTSGVMGRPVTSARMMLVKKHMSCVMGHVQTRDIAFATKADGTRMTGIFGGIFYQHDEEYLNPQTNRDWRGIWMLNEINNGQFDELPVSMDYLRKRYG